ncbi:MAG: nucleotide exchange factor GrpE [Gammaproteobacteria bacterium]|nr:MAG: nucleotide exchange factor GrpE [Gammaproteobacteria bacterium]
MTSKAKEEMREKDEQDLEEVEVEEVLEEFDEHNREVSHQQFEEMREALAKAEDEALRSRAEVENIRRRAENDVASARKFAVEKFAAEVLLVRDSLDHARKIDLDQENREILEKMKEGLDLTMKQLETAMEKFNIEEIAPQEGERLDPEKHQAMGLIEAEGIDANCIAQVIQKGFTINGRLLRPAMVMVAK